MKHSLRILSFLAVCAVATLVSCGEPETTPTTVAAPTELAANDVQDNSAVLSWSGEASTYEVIVGDATAQTVDAKTFTATELTAGTTYTWKVRAKSGDDFSIWVNGPEFTTTGGATEVAAPTNLNVTDVTETSASFTWEGTTASYELMIGNADAIAVDAKTFTAQKLTPGAQYAWKVRAKEGDAYSQWVNGTAFTTDEETPVGPDTHVWKKAIFLPFGGTEVKNYYLRLFDESMTDTASGLILMLDLYAPGTANVISDGTYTVGGYGAWEIDVTGNGRGSNYGTSGLVPVVNGAQGQMDYLVSGTFKINKNSDGTYKVVTNFMTGNGVSIVSTYKGAVTTM